MRGPLRSLLRVRFLWLPAVVLLFAYVLLAATRLPVGGGAAAVVAAGFVTVAAVLAVGLSRSLFG